MASKPQDFRTLSICFRDERIPTVKVKLGRSILGPYSKTVPVKLPTGEKIEVYVEVFDPDTLPDVSIYVNVGDEQPVGLRCTSGVVLCWESPGGCECTLQVGTGPWE